MQEKLNPFYYFFTDKMTRNELANIMNKQFLVCNEFPVYSLIKGLQYCILLD